MKRWWCRLFHRQPMWPIKGKYLCRICLCEHAVLWMPEPASSESANQETLRTIPGVE